MGIGCMGQKAGARDDVGRYEPSIVDYAVPSSNESEWIKDGIYEYSLIRNKTAVRLMVLDTSSAKEFIVPKVFHNLPVKELFYVRGKKWEHLIVPNGIEIIDDSALSGMSHLRKVDLGKDVQYGSLEDYISKGTNPSIKICIGRKLSTSFGTSKTEVAGSSVSVKFINAATVTINGLTDHGSSNSIDSFVKYGTDFYFSITPDAGYVPTVKYSAQDENGNEIIEEETLEADISPDENNSSYHYTINGENIIDDIQDIQIEVSYEKTLTRTVEITTNGGNVSVNDKAESDQASVEIAPESRSIKLKPGV